MLRKNEILRDWLLSRVDLPAWWAADQALLGLGTAVVYPTLLALLSDQELSQRR